MWFITFHFEVCRVCITKTTWYYIVIPIYIQLIYCLYIMYMYYIFIKNIVIYTYIYT